MSAGLEDTQPATPDSQPGAASRATPLPATISRFTVREKLGQGGNGVVLLAVDPLLDRNVAIKILRKGGSTEASQRLLREAQSAAKLAHDSVIVIHEVGTFEDQVYVAMEHVPGGTLSRWQRGRPWREVLEVYLRAGRGLAAAHAAGMVHRDFKPDNVLVGDDGRVRVTDFGLVSVSGTRAEAVRELAGAALSTTLTRTGTVMGTPRYMAPEQHLGEDVDARADQFAFCAALYEALWERAPFDGDTYGALADHVLAGELVAPPPGEVPAGVRAAVMRGLSRQREDRFPSMMDLLAALATSAPRRRRWVVPAVVALIAVALSVFFVERRRRSHEVGPAKQAFDEARAAFDHGDYSAAAEGFKRAARLDPELDTTHQAYLYDLASSYDRLGNCTEASADYQRYLAIGMHIDAATRTSVEQRLRELGDCRPHDAPETVDSIMKAGEDAYGSGDFASAVSAFKRAFALDPKISDSPKYFYDIAQAYRQMGNCSEASFAYKKYLALRPELAADKRAHLEETIRELDDCVAQQGSAAPR